MPQSPDTPDFSNIPRVSQEIVDLTIKLESIFLPIGRSGVMILYSRDEATGQVNQSARFVHYTSAEGALKIIRSKRLWMRNAMSMTDYSEVQHGFNILLKFFSDAANKSAFCAALDSCAEGVAVEALNLFDQNWNTTRFHTYISSISEHLAAEDLHGRLSMWRAFGTANTARVALVLNIPWNTGEVSEMNVLFSPVSYLDEVQAHETLARRHYKDKLQSGVFAFLQQRHSAERRFHDAVGRRYLRKTSRFSGGKRVAGNLFTLS